jgi:hypothetical protein
MRKSSALGVHLPLKPANLANSGGAWYQNTSIAMLSKI